MKRKLDKSFILGGLSLLSVAIISCKQSGGGGDAGTFFASSSDAESIFTTEEKQNAFTSVLPPLNDFLKRRLAALKFIENTPTDQLKPITLSARTTAEQRSGVRRIRIRHHQIINDSDYTNMGYRLGPGSPESALSVLASDIADTYLSQAALKGVRIDSLGVSIVSHPDSVKPAKRIVHPHNLFYTIYVKSPASDEELEELRQLTEKSSPIFNFVSTKQVLKREIDYKETPKDLVAKPPYQPGLREFLKYQRIASLSRRGSRTDTTQRARPLRNNIDDKPDRLHVEVDPVTGARRLHVRYFNLINDNPSYLAGNDLGPSSLELQLGILTSCINHVAEGQAALREVALDSLAISAQGTYDPRAGRPGFENVPNYPHNINYTFHIRSPHSYDEIVALIDATEAVCPIYNLAISEQKINGRVVRSNKNLDTYRVHPQYYTDYKWEY
jgi:hypothetical protein